jgi:hypothetical protein
MTIIRALLVRTVSRVIEGILTRSREPHLARLVEPILAVVLLSVASTAMAADLVGTVRKGRKPLANQEVKLQRDGDTRQTKSNREGRFVFVGIPPGTYRLSCGGDSEAEISIRAGASSQDCTLR